MNTRNLLTAIAAFGFVSTATSFAQAEIIQYNNNANASYYETTPALVPITSTGAQSINFVTKKAGLVAVTFSAECAVYGPAGNEWLSIDIRVDGIAIAPTEGDNDAFCTQVSGEYVYSTNSITVARVLTKGAHTLTVQSSVTGGTGWLDDVAVTVWR